MKFADIPKFTRDADYKVNVSLDALLPWLISQEDLDLQINPDFQRGHVWSEEQEIAYIEYFLRGGTSGLDLYFNMPGWLTTFKGDYVCVDGLQRITAALRFINNKIPVFGYYVNEFEDKLFVSHESFIVHINNLQTRKEVLTWYLEINSAGVAHTEVELDKIRELIQELE